MPATKASKKDQAALLSSDPPAATKTSKKRKGDANAPKYYAVRAGNKPGVYLTWSECQEQTSGFRGASYKSFTNQEDAEAYVAGKKTSAAAEGGAKFYAVAVGREPGIYTDWDDASLAIKGWKAPKYRKFDTQEGAVEFIRAHGNDAAQEWLSGIGEEPQSKKTKLDTKPETKPDTKLDAKLDAKPEPKPDADDESDVLQIFTDGSSLANGRAGAAAGVGVFFGKRDKRNVSERLEGSLQTNQRAELTAIVRALELTKEDESVRIYTDSRYSIDCSINWYRAWERNDWKKPNGDAVLNQDLIKRIRALIVERDKAGFKTGFQWVKGHSANAGNIAADKLAVAGAKKKR